jgi:hypothetical protein
LSEFNLTEVPLDDPENDFGDALSPYTVMVTSEDFFVDPFTLVVTVKNVFEPIGDDVVVVLLFAVAYTK